MLDPFMGGGTTVVEALRLGCKVIGLDVNPVAWFITKKSVEPVDLSKLQEAFKSLERTVAPEILQWYRTQCPKGHEADVMYVFWVKTVECSSCGKKTRLFNSFRIATKGGKDAVICPACYTVQWVESGEMKLPALPARQNSSRRKVSHQVGSLGVNIVVVRMRQLNGFAEQGKRQITKCSPLNTGVNNATNRPTGGLVASERLKQKREATRVQRNLTEISTCKHVKSLRSEKRNCLCLR